MRYSVRSSPRTARRDLVPCCRGVGLRAFWVRPSETGYRASCNLGHEARLQLELVVPARRNTDGVFAGLPGCRSKGSYARTLAKA